MAMEPSIENSQPPLADTAESIPVKQEVATPESTASNPPPASTSLPRRGFLGRRGFIGGATATFVSILTGAAFKPNTASAQGVPPRREMPPPVAIEPKIEEQPQKVEEPKAYALPPTESTIPRNTHYFNNSSGDIRSNAQEVLGTSKRIYAALGVEDFIDEVQTINPDILSGMTQTSDPNGAAQVTEDGRRVIYIRGDANSQIASISTQIHEVFHLFDPEMGGLNKFPPEQVAQWKSRRQQAMQKYNELFLSQDKPLGHADSNDVSSPKDAPDRQFRAEREAFAMIGERLILNQKELPAELTDLKNLTAEIYQTISGQTIEQAREKIQQLGVDVY